MFQCVAMFEAVHVFGSTLQ